MLGLGHNNSKVHVLKHFRRKLGPDFTGPVNAFFLENLNNFFCTASIS